MKPASIGSVSHGTMNPEHLVPRLHDELEWQLQRQERTPENMTEIDKLHEVYGWVSDQCYDDNGDLIDDADTLDSALHELFDALERFAPAYCYFGAHEGDGSDYGYWPCHDQIDELPCYSDLSEVPADIDEDFRIVNDHGNVSVYSADGRALLEIV